MGRYNTQVKSLVYRIKDTIKLIDDLDVRLSISGLSMGKKQALLKDRSLKISKVKSMLKRLDELSSGNILTITFQEEESGDRYRTTYTNISKDDAITHLKLVASIKGVRIQILEVKEVQTQNSLTKL